MNCGVGQYALRVLQAAVHGFWPVWWTGNEVPAVERIEQYFGNIQRSLKPSVAADIGYACRWRAGDEIIQAGL